MIVTHTERYTFPNTAEGRSAAENWESILHRMGIKAAIHRTTASISVGYEETIAFKPSEFEVMREPNDKEVRDA